MKTFHSVEQSLKEVRSGAYAARVLMGQDGEAAGARRAARAAEEADANHPLGVQALLRGWLAQPGHYFSLVDSMLIA